MQQWHVRKRLFFAALIVITLAFGFGNAEERLPISGIHPAGASAGRPLDFFNAESDENALRRVTKARPRNVCGNGRLDPGEACDRGLAQGMEGACPTHCDDSDPCTLDSMRGWGTCKAQCRHLDWCASTPQSAYFRNDPVAEAILSGRRVYDLESEFPFGCGYFLGARTDDWGYKLFNGLKQGGYTDLLSCDMVGDMPMEKLLNRFQQNEGLLLSKKLDRAGMTRLDALVLAAEQRVASRNVAGEFVCWPLMREAPPLNSSKAHVGYLHLLAYESFPAALQLTEEECFDRQLLLQNNGSVVWDPAAWPEVADDGTLQNPRELANGVTFDDYSVVATAIHEFAHMLDGDAYPHARPGGRPRIDTAGFINISFDYSSRFWDGWVYYRLRPDPGDTDEMRRHFFSYGQGWQNGTESGYYTAAEDFATCVSMYILHGAVFRDYAASRPPLAAKYAWLRDHVFEGVEYYTGDPEYAAYAPDLYSIGGGCGDVTCFQGLKILVDPGYVWDYATPKASARMVTESVRPAPSNIHHSRKPVTE